MATHENVEHSECLLQDHLVNTWRPTLWQRAGFPPAQVAKRTKWLNSGCEERSNVASMWKCIVCGSWQAEHVLICPSMIAPLCKVRWYQTMWVLCGEDE